MYNKERDAQFHMKAKTPLAKRLKKIIEDCDNKDLGSIYKGYFYCIFKNSKFFINPTLLPEEIW